jgi:hypothetical protein
VTARETQDVDDVFAIQHREVYGLAALTVRGLEEWPCLIANENGAEISASELEQLGREAV